MKLNKDAKSLIDILEKARGVQERLTPLKVCYFCLRTLMKFDDTINSRYPENLNYSVGVKPFSQKKLPESQV